MSTVPVVVVVVVVTGTLHFRQSSFSTSTTNALGPAVVVEKIRIVRSFSVRAPHDTQGPSYGDHLNWDQRFEAI